MKMPWTKDQSLTISYSPLSAKGAYKSEVVLRPNGLYQIGGDLEKIRKPYMPKGIILARLVTNNLADPFAFFTSPREYVATLIPLPFEEEGINDLHQNPVYMSMDKRKIVVVDPFNREGVEEGVSGLDTFGGQNIEHITASSNRVKLRGIHFDVKAEGYQPSKFVLIER